MKKNDFSIFKSIKEDDKINSVKENQIDKEIKIEKDLPTNNSSQEKNDKNSDFNNKIENEMNSTKSNVNQNEEEIKEKPLNLDQENKAEKVKKDLESIQIEDVKDKEGDKKKPQTSSENKAQNNSSFNQPDFQEEYKKLVRMKDEGNELFKKGY